MRERSTAATRLFPSEILSPFLVSRALLAGLTLVVAVVLRQAPASLWTRWDGQWYLGIAEHGYHWGIGGKPALAFAPLYPLLVRAGLAAGWPGIAAGLIISNAAFLGALFYLHALVAEARGAEIARRTVWLVALLPTAFFFLAPYSESLFLLCAVAALYHARRVQTGRAALWAGLGMVARPTGIILLPVILVALARRRAPIPVLLASCLPAVASVAAYLWYLSWERLPLDVLLGAQRNWHRALTFPWTGFVASVQWLAAHAAANIPWAVENILQLAVTVVFLGLTVAAWRYLSSAERMYCAGFWALVLTSPEWLNHYYAPFSSMDRFVLALFPLFGWLAGRIPHHRFGAVLAANAAFMLGAATVHLTGGWVG